MSPILLTILTFGAVVTGIAGIYSVVSDLYLRDRSKLAARIDDEFRRRQRARAEQALLFKDLSKLVADAQAEEIKLTPRQRFEAMVEQSGLEVTPQQLLLISTVLAASLGAVGFVIRQNLIMAIIGAVLGGAMPIIYVSFKRKARLNKLLEQLPDAFDLMARVVRAGQTISQALQSVSDEFPNPIAGEFNYCYEQQNLGLPVENAMRDLARRTGLLEIKIFVLALIVQQEGGGNLAELLDKLSTVIRDRQRVRGQIQALTAEGRMQAAILLGLPPGIFVLLMGINPEYMSTLLNYPWLIAITVICEGLGALWIRSIVNFDF